MKSIFAKIIIIIIRGYRLLLSPWLGNHCRFHPSCSTYALEAVEHHGPIYGLWLSTKRIAKYHPWHQGGCDPVPRKSQNE